MEPEDVQLLTLYISAWAWHIISVIMLSTLIIALLLSKYIFVFGLAPVLIITEYLAWNKKRILEELAGF